MLESIDHVNLVVRDLPRMTRFYQEVLGLQVTKEVTISGDWIDAVVGLSGVTADVVYLELPAGPRIELIYYQQPPSPEPSDTNSAHLPGIRHMAFRVRDIDAVVERLQQAGAEFQSGVAAVPSSQVTYAGDVRKRLVYFRDPKGNLLELCEYRTVPS